ncbi:DUF1071 domain-containing protein [Tumidithrix helvetica PCC 7403]|uniref:DUF1071 domain-containing protein n=1 Tax=Tumidithrix helvetica TaxID=3457545 RepID=UPI003C9E5766
MNSSNVVSINQPQTEKKQRPTQPREWTIAQITEALSRRLPEKLLDTKKQGGATLAFISWYKIPPVLDKYAPGWTWEIRQINHSSDRVFVMGRLTIPTVNGDVWREATGTELLKEEKPIYIDHPEGELNQKGEVKKIPLCDELGRIVTESKEVAYGDPSSNAEGMAFRRAAAKFGLGLYLYEK